MVEILTTLVFAVGGVAFALLVGMPFYNKVNNTREKYHDVMARMAR
ncbi:MAG: hypothetical protein GX351_07560 [Peptococcaceae bacterium]|jgi:hypothetical protein|nr:hypothetical protein [Peptococcaceae bacterium]